MHPDFCNRQNMSCHAHKARREARLKADLRTGADFSGPQGVLYGGEV